MAHTEHKPSIVAKGLKLAIVCSRFNELITKELLDGALDALNRLSAKDGDCKAEIFWVPGSFEIPGTIARLLEKGGWDGVLAVGCLIEGNTDHYKLLASEVTKGCAMLALKHPVPIGFGVLTTPSLDTALERAGTKAGNKGADAMESLLETIAVYKGIIGA
jgi:6,7-dimethyl-8-ribityllumazine synthase